MLLEFVDGEGVRDFLESFGGDCECARNSLAIKPPKIFASSTNVFLFREAMHVCGAEINCALKRYVAISRKRNIVSLFDEKDYNKRNC